MQMIYTGLQKLDDFLSGGIPPGVIVDIFGENGTGKTLLLLQLSINSIKIGGNVLYLDTTGGFRPERILEIQKESKICINLLEKIMVSRITNTSEQIKSLKDLEKNDFSLIVIDNITDLFSYEYPNDNSIFEKNSLFMKYMHELSKFAITKKIPIVVTNMVRSIEGREVENMKNAIDPFTHIKIHLFKSPSKFTGQIYWALKKKSFSYTISKIGISDNDECC
jgi:DNA repair protein RAD51